MARLRIYLYHIPAVSGVPIGHALLERLLKAYPKVIAGIKDSGGDWQHTQSLIKHFGKPPRQREEEAGHFLRVFAGEGLGDGWVGGTRLAITWSTNEPTNQSIGPSPSNQTGSEAFLLQTLRAGGQGCISATANVNPRAIHEVKNMNRKGSAQQQT